MEWERFPIPEFDYAALATMAYQPPELTSKAEAMAAVSTSMDTGALKAGAFVCEPDTALVERFNFRGEYAAIVLCVVPKSGASVLARSRAWFKQRVIVLDANTADANILHEWKTLRPFNTRLGPDDGVRLDHTVIWLLIGRILCNHTRANRVMVDTTWKLGGDRMGFRILAANDTEQHQFHESCIELSWPS